MSLTTNTTYIQPNETTWITNYERYFFPKKCRSRMWANIYSRYSISLLYTRPGGIIYIVFMWYVYLMYMSVRLHSRFKSPEKVQFREEFFYIFFQTERPQRVKKKKFKKTLITDFEVILQPLVHTFAIISTLYIYIYSLTIEQFLMHPFSMCMSLRLALVSKIAL